MVRKVGILTNVDGTGRGIEQVAFTVQSLPGVKSVGRTNLYEAAV